MLGPLERPVSDAYRSLYLDLGDFAGLMLQWQPTAKHILEVGCGEGAVTRRLTAAYPGAGITAIDITPRVGRLYDGPRKRVSFIRCPVEEIAARQPRTYDLVVLSDVLHHVPTGSRHGVLDSIRTALAPGGTLIFKDWQKNATPIHWLCHASDRWLTGDRVIYMNREEMRNSLSKAFGESALVAEARVRPRWNNLAILVRP
jgi:2-polyprenyl-6-hydroxyphenyl methylase/3-demethylubiquinone-9 3-methyltransferase